MPETGKKANPRNARRSSREVLAQAAIGIKTAQDFALFMKAMMSALVKGDIDAKTGAAVVASAMAMLKVIRMQLEFGVRQEDGNYEPLLLVSPKPNLDNK